MPKFSRRQVFVDRILLEHPLLARSLVNRLWAVYLGRGIVHPVDRMDSVHPASHPALLEWLSDDFRRSGYDIRRLARSILRSRTYQLDSRPATPTALPEHFASCITKPLTAEQLVRSIQVAVTGQADEADAGILKEFRKAFPDVLPEDPQATPAQALLVSNNPNLLQLVNASPLLQQAASMNENEGVTQTLFQHVFGRPADADELQHATEFLAAPSDQKQTRVQMLLWTLLASSEFYLNH